MVDSMIFLLPTVLFFGLGVRALDISNGQDGYLYVGAVARLSDFLARFPDAYYGVRFGYILPQIVFNRILGVKAGFLALRLIMLGFICVTMRAKGRLRPAAAVLSTVVISTSPIILVAIFNTYTLSTGVLALLGGACLLATHDRNDATGRIRIGLAGVCFAISWNSHFVVLPLCILLVIVFLVEEMWQLRRIDANQVFSHALLITAGSAIVVVSAVLLYGLRFGIWNVYTPTLVQSRKPTDPFYLEPGWRWIAWRSYLLVGPLSSIAGVLAWRTEVDGYLRTVLRRLTMFSTLSFLLFAAFQWLQDDPLLATYFYSAAPLSLCVVTLAFSVAVTVQRQSHRVEIAVVGSLCVLVLIAAAFGSRFGGPVAAVAIAAIGWSGVTILGARRRDWKYPTGVAALVLVATWAAVSSPHDFPATPGGFRTDPNYDEVLFAYDENSLDKVEIVDEFARALPSLPDERGELRVWFDPGSPLEQMSAPFVWYRSALQSAADDPMPSVSPTVRMRVLDDRPRFVVVVNVNEKAAQLAAAEVSLLAPYSVVSRWSIHRGRTTAHVVLLERASGTWPDFPCDSPGRRAPAICPSG
jgi:hypothetical protein